jgi:hypothetical protein
LEIHKHFIYSLETISDENCDSEKYKYLNYIEFIEFICRIAIKLYEKNKEEESLDHKVQNLMKKIYEQEQILNFKPEQGKLDLSF